MNPTEIDSGTWAIVAEFDGPWHAWRLGETHECDGVSDCVIPLTHDTPGFDVPEVTRWRTSLAQGEYEGRVGRIHDSIDAGTIAQVNLCRVLSIPLADTPPARAVARRLHLVHPVPYWGWFDFAGTTGPRTWLVGSSPELAFSVAGGRIRLAPIKGTAPTGPELLEKDYQENALVAGALLDELAEVARDPRIVAAGMLEQHPRMVQLSTRIEADLPHPMDGEGWLELLETLLPPLSVTGVPREAATELIGSLEPVPRGPYCGVMGWVDLDAGRAELGATIRSFWWDRGELRLGTGAGITRDSDPAGEWEETQFKARTLISALSEAMTP